MPSVNRMSVFDTVKVRVRRDLEHHCVDLLFDGPPDAYGMTRNFVISVWSEGGEQLPEVEMLPDQEAEKTENPVKEPATVAELEAILNSEGDQPVTVNPDGSISKEEEIKF